MRDMSPNLLYEYIRIHLWESSLHVRIKTTTTRGLIIKRALKVAKAMSATAPTDVNHRCHLGRGPFLQGQHTRLPTDITHIYFTQLLEALHLESLRTRRHTRHYTQLIGARHTRHHLLKNVAL